MEVIHICQRDDPKTGGAVQVAALLVKNLNKIEGVNARLLFLYGAPGYFASIIPQYCIHLGLKGSSEAIIGAAKLRACLQHASIVHHHDSLIWPNLVSISCFSVRRVIHVHIAPRPLMTWKMRMAALAQRYRVSRFITITDEMAKSYADLGLPQDRVFTLKNTIDCDRFRRDPAVRASVRKSLGISDSQSVVGFVGRLHNIMKGVDDFIRVIAALPGNYIGLVAGDGEDREEIEQQANDMGIKDKVIFLGAVDETEKYYAAMDAFLFTSHYEHYGLAPLEAIAAGVPVYSFRCEGGFAEWATDDLIYHAADRDHQRMAIRIAAELVAGSSRERASRASEWARLTVSPEAAAESLVRQYSELLGTTQSEVNRLP